MNVSNCGPENFSKQENDSSKNYQNDPKKCRQKHWPLGDLNIATLKTLLNSKKKFFV